MDRFIIIPRYQLARPLTHKVGKEQLQTSRNNAGEELENQ
jgi:hypothetical protein